MAFADRCWGRRGRGCGTARTSLWVFVAVRLGVHSGVELIRRICFATFRINDASWFDAVVTWCFWALMAGWPGRRLSAAWAYLAAMAACGVVNAWWLRRNRPLFQFQASPILEDWKKNWALGKWIYASLIITLLAGITYPWLLLVFHGPRATGIWGACFGMVNLGNPFQLGIQNYLAPKSPTPRLQDRRASTLSAQDTAVYGMMLPYSCCSWRWGIR